MSSHRSKYPVIQQVCKVLGGTEYLARCTLAKVEESSVWTSIVNRTEGNRANSCRGLDGKPLFSALYGMYTVTLNELKTILKASV
jgi:hypothetical protein